MNESEIVPNGIDIKNINRSDFLNIPFLKIGILEDNVDYLERYKEILHRFKYETLIFEKQEEIVKAVKENRVSNCIIDLNLGKDRDQEGISAIEQIRVFNKNIFCGVLTNYPKRLKTMAERVGASCVFGKSRKINDDIYKILLEMSLYTQKMEKRRESAIRAMFQSQESTFDREFRLNRTSLDQKKIDEPWLESVKGKYVAFAYGKYLGDDYDRSELILKLRKEGISANIFITSFLDEILEEFDILSPIDIE